MFFLNTIREEEKQTVIPDTFHDKLTVIARLRKDKGILEGRRREETPSSWKERGRAKRFRVK